MGYILWSTGLQATALHLCILQIPSLERLQMYGAIYKSCPDCLGCHTTHSKLQSMNLGTSAAS